MHRPTCDKMHPTKQARLESSVVLYCVDLEPSFSNCYRATGSDRGNNSAVRRIFQTATPTPKKVRSNTPLLCSCTTLRTHPARVHIHTHNKTKRLLPGAVGHKGVKSMPVKPKVINYGFQSSQTNCRKRRGKKTGKNKTRLINLACVVPFVFLS